MQAIKSESWDSLWAPAVGAFEAEDYPSALPMFREAVARSQEFKSDDLRRADALFMLGFTLFLDFQLDEVESLFVDSMSLRIRHLGPAHPLVSLTLQRLGDYYNVVGDWEQAEKALHGSLVLLDILGEQYQDRLHKAQVLRSLALSLRRTGQYFEAREHMLRALSLLENEVGPAASGLTIILHSDLASLSLTFMDYQAADQHMSLVVAKQEQAVGPVHPLVGSACQVLGQFCARQGEFGRAEGLLERARTILCRDAQRDIPTDLLESLATVKACLGKLESALELWTELSRIRQQQGLLVESATALEEIAWVYLRTGRMAQASACVAGGMQVLARAVADSTAVRDVTAALRRVLGFIQWEIQDLDGALKHFQAALTLVARGSEADPATPHARILCDIGVTQLEMGELAQAEQSLLDSLLIQAGCVPPDDNTKVRALRSLVTTLHRRGDGERAADTARHLLVTLETTGGCPAEILEITSLVSSLYVAVPHLEESRRYADKALLLARNMPGLTSANLVWLEKLAEQFRTHDQSQLADWLAGETHSILSATVKEGPDPCPCWS